MSGVSQAQLSDGVFVHAVLTVNAHDQSKEAESALLRILDAASFSGRVRRVELEFRTLPKIAAYLSPAWRKEVVCDLADLNVVKPYDAERELLLTRTESRIHHARIVHHLVPDAQRGMAVAEGSRRGGSARSKKHALLREWMWNDRQRRRAGNSHLSDHAIAKAQRVQVQRALDSLWKRGGTLHEADSELRDALGNSTAKDRAPGVSTIGKWMRQRVRNPTH